MSGNDAAKNPQGMCGWMNEATDKQTNFHKYALYHHQSGHLCFCVFAVVKICVTLPQKRFQTQQLLVTMKLLSMWRMWFAADCSIICSTTHISHERYDVGSCPKMIRRDLHVPDSGTDLVEQQSMSLSSCNPELIKTPQSHVTDLVLIRLKNYTLWQVVFNSMLFWCS